MSLDEDTLRALFERSQKTNPDKMQFSEEESTRFQKSFEDPEFRKLFADYMDELQDPKNREETEAYISQLEGEQKVPEGKELIRPEPAFVAKSFKIVKKDSNDKEKVFLNIVKSDKINVPSKSTTQKGTCWSVPYSLGPPHMEKDKNGSNAPCFDCCFHPDAIALGLQHKEFKDLLVTTAMEGVEKLYQQQGQDVTINREFHIVKGLHYKQGPVPTMMIAVAAKENWKDKDGKVPVRDTSKKATVPATALSAPIPAKASDPSGMDFSAELEAPDVTAEKPKSAAVPAIKKGFLTNSKGAIYGDKLTTIRKKPAGGDDSGRAPANNISLVEQSTSGGLHNLSVPSGSTAAKGAKTGSGSNGLIQELKKGEKVNAASVAAPTSTKAPAAAVGGLTAVSTTKRTSTPAAVVVPPRESTGTASSTASSTPLSPSGRREVTVTSPSGSEAPEYETPDTEQENGLEKPKYSMKERGVVSMGDFENLNTAARSNRPSELIFRVELPKIVKASQIVLDIAERLLNLSYPEVYSLSVRLPYPVFDSKGTAKYDKASKSLTITLPVRPPPVSSVSSPMRPTGPVTTISSENASELGEVVEEGESAQKRSTPAKKASVGHGRWVESSPVGSKSSEAAAEGLSLHEEVKRQAELALREAQSTAAATRGAPSVAAVAKATAPVAANSTTSVPPELPTGHFIASSSFGGKKSGYVFQRGDEGVGYYLDKRDPIKPATREAAPVAATAEPTPAPVAAPLQPFPFECRQTKPALALIVEVPNIDKASLSVEFGAYSVRVSFKAFADIPVEGSASTSVGAVLYGAILQLRELDCPGGLDASLCRFDAQKQNLAIVLTKAQAQFWHSSADQREAVVSAGESKSGDITSDETRSLFQVVPYVPTTAAKTFEPVEALSPPPAAIHNVAAQTSSANAEAAKALKALESSIQAMQFSSSDALFELD